jgi:hypothetical protein
MEIIRNLHIDSGIIDPVIGIYQDSDLHTCNSTIDPGFRKGRLIAPSTLEPF